METPRSLEESAASAFLWDYSGNIAGMGVTFAIGVVLARLLAPEEFGLVAMVTVLIGLFQGLMDVGFSSALVQRSDPAAEHYTSVFLLNVLLGLVLTAVGVIGAPLVAAFYGEPRLIPLTRVLALGFALRSLCLVHEAWLRKHLAFRVLTQVRLGAAALGGAAGIILALRGWGVWSLVCQSLLSSFVTATGLWVLGEWRPRGRLRWSALRELWAYGSHLFAAGLLNALFTRLDVLIVGRLFSAVDLGFFTRAKGLIRLVVRVSSDSGGRVMFPVLSSIQDEEERFLRVSLQSLTLVSFAAFFLSGWLFVVAEPLIALLLTDVWSPAAPLLRLFCLSAYVIPVNSIVLSMLKSKGRSKVFLQLEIVKKVLYLAALTWGFWLGIEGFLVALALVSIVNTAINMVPTARVVGLGAWALPRLVAPFALAAVLASSAVSAGVPMARLGRPQALVVATVVFAAAYLLVNRLMGTDGLRLALALARQTLTRKVDR